MKHNTQFYIDGEWVDPTSSAFLDVINPATEGAIARISLGSAADVDLAVKAARRAFPAYSQTSRPERLDLLRNVISVFEARFDEVAEAITAEMGSPLWFSKQIQTDTALAHFKQA
jgi:aldehyde dehydrogenase (NAD+)